MAFFFREVDQVHGMEKIGHSILLSQFLQILVANIPGIVRELELFGFMIYLFLGEPLPAHDLVLEGIHALVDADQHLQLLLFAHVHWNSNKLFIKDLSPLGLDFILLELACSLLDF